MKNPSFRIRGSCSILIVVFSLALAEAAIAWDQPQWVRQLGTAEYDSPSGVATDAAGHVYISGSTYGTLAGPQRGTGDVWFAKFSTDGAVLWKRQLGTSSEDSSSGVATDRDGNIYISGSTYGSLGGPQRGNGDAWLAKYSAAGTLLWKTQLGTSEYDESTAVTTDAHGYVYIAGTTTGALYGVRRDAMDAWLAKYSPSGNLLWIRQFGVPSCEEVCANRVSGIIADKDNNIYMLGKVEIDYGCRVCYAFRSWVSKYSPSGVLLRAYPLEQVSFSYVAAGPTTDRRCDVYVAVNADGQAESWLLEYSVAGALIWKDGKETTEKGEFISAIASHENGEIFIAGQLSYYSESLPEKYVSDAWIAGYSPTRARLWKRLLRTRADDAATAIATDGHGNLYVTGTTAGALAGANKGQSDVWLAEYYTRR